MEIIDTFVINTDFQLLHYTERVAKKYFFDPKEGKELYGYGYINVINFPLEPIILK